MNEQILDTFLKDGLSGYMEELTELCAQPSVSARSEGTHDCAPLVAKLLQRHGFEVQQFETPGNPIIVGQMSGQSERTLLLYNHYDVQPPEPLELWETPPFKPTIRNEALYARGAKDDKGELVARLAAVDAVRDAHNGNLPCGITMVVEGEEEIGSPHIAQFVQDHLELLASHGSIWEEGGIDSDGRPVIGLGRRGILAVQLSVRTMTQDAHSGGAHNLPNAAWRLAWALVTLKGHDERILIPGFYDEAQSPSELDMQLMEELADVESIYRETFGIKTFLRGATGVELHSNVFEPTCNIQGIDAGYQGSGIKTVIPSVATAKLDFRLVPNQDPDDILEKLRAHLEAQEFADVEVQRLGAMWPDKASPDDPFVELTGRTAQAVYGKPARCLPLGGGSSPAYAFSRPLGGIPVVTAGVGYWDNRVHAPNEHVRLNDFLNASRQIARIIEGFGDLS